MQSRSPQLSIVRWLSSFLYRRQQRVKLGSEISGWNSINVGVPQGPLLGPVGFLVHINYCRPSATQSNMWMTPAYMGNVQGF